MAMVFKTGGREYPLPDFDTITFVEARKIKAATGLRMGELLPAFAAGDTDALLALFIVSKMRTDGDFDLADLDGLAVSSIEVSDDGAPEPVEDPGPLAKTRAKPATRPRQPKRNAARA